ncbi:hypothetical protein [Acanthopleuribacter pedis]|uniref:Uncharacterized protein n=1 Tax=Acanthopleuribacter pedis TaxID=442870 RepID=A0A8J7QC77_9BACT|nr:hypothetical protein [Acanthopleuribacter pedis]MBO1321444.1 hypothetical protein [Acanthopleuribacter pedis]
MSSVGKPPNINSTPLIQQQKIEKPKDPQLSSTTLQQSQTSWNPFQGLMNRMKMGMPETGDQVIDTKLITPMKDMTPQFPVYQGLEDTFHGRMTAMQRLYSTGQLPMVKPFFENLETMQNTVQNIDTLDKQDMMELGGTYVKDKIENLNLVKIPKHTYQFSTVSKDKLDELQETQQQMVTKTKQKVMVQVGTSVGVGQMLRKTGQMVSRGNARLKVLGLTLQGMGLAFGGTGGLKIGYDMQDMGGKVGTIVKDQHPTTQLFIEKMNNPKQKSIQGPDPKD